MCNQISNHPTLMHLMAYLEAYLSISFKYVLSDPVSEGRCGSWASVIISILVGEGVGSGDEISMLGDCGLGAQGCIGIGCLRGFLWGYDNESLHFFLRIVLIFVVAYVSDS